MKICINIYRYQIYPLLQAGSGSDEKSTGSGTSPLVNTASWLEYPEILDIGWTEL